MISFQSEDSPGILVVVFIQAYNEPLNAVKS
jgi:hypothetical protein